MKKYISRFISVCLVTVILAGCGSSSDPVPTETPTAEATAAAASATPASEPVILTVWYEGGDARLPFFKSVEAEMQKDYPNISINAVTFDNTTFMTKVLQAATVTGGVDLVFNDATRIIQLQQQSSNGFLPLNDVLESAPNHEVVLDSDLKMCTQGEDLIVLPVNRTIAGLGVKTDVPGVEVTEETMPTDFTKFVALGQKYKENGLNGFTMHLGTDPGQVFNLFLAGNGMENVWINNVPESQIATNKEYFEKIISLYTDPNSFWDQDAISESFAEMYPKIQSGSVGMFRVGNWNAAGWDAPDSGVGEYTVVPWPSFTDGGKGTLVELNTRGFAIPKNATNIEEAKIFLQYVYGEAPQKASFETMGSCLDTSVVDKTKLTKNQQIFFDESIPLTPIDNYVGSFSYYNELLEVYETGLKVAFSSTTPEELSANLDKLDASINEAIQKNKQ